MNEIRHVHLGGTLLGSGEALHKLGAFYKYDDGWGAEPERWIDSIRIEWCEDKESYIGRSFLRTGELYAETKGKHDQE